MRFQIAVVGVAGVLALSMGPARAGVDDAQAMALLKKGGCNVCHAVDKKVVGPSFADVAAKRKAGPDAVAALMKTVRAGSKGAYGAVPMPPNPVGKLSDAELHDLLEWVLTK